MKSASSASSSFVLRRSLWYSSSAAWSARSIVYVAELRDGRTSEVNKCLLRVLWQLMEVALEIGGMYLRVLLPPCHVVADRKHLRSNCLGNTCDLQCDECSGDTPTKRLSHHRT